MMKKTICLLTAALMICALCGCKDEEPESSEKTSRSVSTKEESSQQTETPDEVRAVSSSLVSPLGMDEWGSAAKFSPDQQKYFNVPLRVVRVTAGSEAEKRVRDFCSSDKTYTFKKPEKGCEWVIADYEISLDGFPAGKGGADTAVVAFVTGTDGKTVEYKGKKYAVTTVCMTDGKYYFEGTGKGSTAFIVPENFRDYTIAFGEYGETQAYFTQSKKTALAF